jgi:hypothetical protein
MAIVVSTAAALLDEAALTRDSGKVAHWTGRLHVEPLPARHPFTALPNVTLSSAFALSSPASTWLGRSRIAGASWRVTEAPRAR